MQKNNLNTKKEKKKLKWNYNYFIFLYYYETLFHVIITKRDKMFLKNIQIKE